MRAEDAATLTPSERLKMSSGLPKQRMEMRDVNGKRRSKVVRGSSKSSNQAQKPVSARKGWTCGDTAIQATDSKDPALGRFRVTMPHGRVKYVRPVAS